MEKRDPDISVALVSGIWFGAVILLAAIFLGAGLQGEFTLIHTAFAALVLVLAFVGTPLAIIWTRDTPDIAKAKRERIDNLLRDMSDEELFELKKRLSDGNYDEEALLEYVSEDGELVFRE